MTKTLLPLGLRSRIGRMVLCIAGVVAFAFPPSTSAVILIEVIGPLTLFEIEGIGFDFYATTNGTRFRVRDTDTEQSGIVNVNGQAELRSELTLIAVSREDRDQKVRIEIDVAPLRGRASGRFFELEAVGVRVGPDPVTDPLLAALEGPLRLGLVLEWQTGHTGGPIRLAVYRLHSVERRERTDALSGYSNPNSLSVTLSGTAGPIVPALQARR
jgi:hypothetical protein